MIVALDQWVKDGKEPPDSAFPTIADGRLVDWHQNKTNFPKIPGVRYPTVIQQPPFADYGPKFHSHGIITIEPPTVKGRYTVLVPASYDNGNDGGTLKLPDILVPVATYTGWNTRRKDVGAEGMLASLLGSCFPLPRTKAERQKSGDPRQSLEDAYSSFAAYRDTYSAACTVYQGRRLLLAEDVDLLVKNLETRRKLFAAEEGK